MSLINIDENNPLYTNVDFGGLYVIGSIIKKTYKTNLSPMFIEVALAQFCSLYSIFDRECLLSKGQKQRSSSFALSFSQYTSTSFSSIRFYSSYANRSPNLWITIYPSMPCKKYNKNSKAISIIHIRRYYSDLEWPNQEQAICINKLSNPASQLCYFICVLCIIRTAMSSRTILILIPIDIYLIKTIKIYVKLAGLQFIYAYCHYSIRKQLALQ